MQKELTPAEAWIDFWENVRPELWPTLTRKQKNEITVANRAAKGMARDRYGKPVTLGHSRLKRILDYYSPPGRYRFEQIIYLSDPA